MEPALVQDGITRLIELPARSASARRAPIAASLGGLGAIGVASKFYTGPGASWVVGSLGGTIYVVFWVLLCAVVLPRVAPAPLALSVLAATCVLELLQLWHPAWLEALRANFVGHALLGSTFSAWDFPHYALGAALGWMWLVCTRRRTSRAAGA